MPYLHIQSAQAVDSLRRAFCPAAIAHVYLQLFDMFRSWREQTAKLERGENIKEEYNRWRYKYPELDQSGRWAKVTSQTLSDALIEELKKE